MAGRLAELVRVTRPGGRVAASTWADPEGPKSMALLKDAFESALPGRALLPRDFDVWTEDAIRAALTGAGCADVDVHRHEGELAAPSPDAMIAQSDPVFRLVPGYAALGEGERAAVLAGLKRRLEPFGAPDGSVHLPMPAFVAVGTR